MGWKKNSCAVLSVYTCTNQNGRLSKLGNLVRVTVGTFLSIIKMRICWSYNKLSYLFSKGENECPSHESIIITFMYVGILIDSGIYSRLTYITVSGPFSTPVYKAWESISMQDATV